MIYCAVDTAFASFSPRPHTAPLPRARPSPSLSVKRELATVENTTLSSGAGCGCGLSVWFAFSVALLEFSGLPVPRPSTLAPQGICQPHQPQIHARPARQGPHQAPPCRSYTGPSWRVPKPMYRAMRRVYCGRRSLCRHLRHSDRDGTNGSM